MLTSVTAGDVAVIFTSCNLNVVGDSDRLSECGLTANESRKTTASPPPSGRFAQRTSVHVNNTVSVRHNVTHDSRRIVVLDTCLTKCQNVEIEFGQYVMY